ncbi:MAG: extracellular solute-binding protein [Candidatus Izemoplasmataceae bacterium]|jgi:arabinogalactan oligomer / maltooligosaccharide transport system substrate-binding protein|uniref:extracellular solute-binding protein n=1 Tax=Liberiplasma polymorphum TaxID=3374570 RepID=UPI0037765C89
MKKIILLILSVATFFTLVACNNTVNDNKIVIWHDKEQAIEDVLRVALQNALPDLDIELVRRESLTDTLKLVGNNPTAAPDMYIFAHDKIGLFAEIGILAPITDFIDEEVLLEYLDLTIEAATYNGTLYQLPLYFETLLFMYNKDRLSLDQVPTTTEELYEYMKNNTDSRRYGFVEQHSNAYYSAGWIHGFGGKILNDDGTPALTDENTLRALEYKLKFLNYMPSGQAEYATINTLFFEKRANSIIAGPWIVPTVRERGINLGFAPMPVVSETGLPIAPYAGIQGIHVLNVAANNPVKRVHIQSILNVLIDPQISIDLALASGVAPAHHAAYLDENILNDELVMAMHQAASNAVPMPNLPEMDIMWLTASDMLVQINLRGVNVLEAATAAQKRSEELIDMMR